MNSLPTKKQLREFGLFVGFLFPFLIGWLIPSFFGHDFRIWTLFLGIPLITIGLFSPNNLRFFYKKWMQLGNSLAFLNSHLILGIVFILVVLPISFLMKLFGYDPLKNKKQKLNSYREFRKDDKINFEKIF